MELNEQRLLRIQEAVKDLESDSLPDSKKSLVSFISANLFRVGNMDGEGSTKALLMLIAALGILSSADDAQSLSSAKRLVSVAFSSSRKTKNK